MEFEGRKGCQGGLSKVTHEQRFDVRTCFEEEQEALSQQKAQQRQRP